MQRVAFGDVNAATARVLAAEGWEVVVPRQGCCGALSAHAGRAKESERLLDRLRRDLAGLPIAVNSSGCGSHLKEHGLDARRRDGAARRAARAARSTRCRSASPTRTRATSDTRSGCPRPGRRFWAGSRRSSSSSRRSRTSAAAAPAIYNIVQPEAARELGDRKAAHVLATDPEALASANPGCLVQLEQALERAGRPLPALHPVELLDASQRGVRAPDLLRQVMSAT